MQFTVTCFKLNVSSQGDKLWSNMQQVWWANLKTTVYIQQEQTFSMKQEEFDFAVKLLKYKYPLISKFRFFHEGEETIILRILEYFHLYKTCLVGDFSKSFHNKTLWNNKNSYCQTVRNLLVSSSSVAWGVKGSRASDFINYQVSNHMSKGLIPFILLHRNHIWNCKCFWNR